MYVDKNAMKHKLVVSTMAAYGQIHSTSRLTWSETRK